MKRFENKHILVTGAARGIGFEIAKQFILEGGQVTIFDYHTENLSTSVRKLSTLTPRAIVRGSVVDVSDHHAVESAVAEAESTAPIDVLINNAGIASETPFLEIEAEEWRRIIDVNLTGMFYVSHAVCKRMAERKAGVVVNMASKNGLDGEGGYVHYNASKGGVVMLTKTMALELARYNIRVNAVCPGYIQTPMSIEIDSPEFAQNFVDRYIPMNRPGKVHEVAPIFLFLASDASSFITGQTFIVDGGQLAGQKMM